MWVSLCCDGGVGRLSVALGEKFDGFKLPQGGVDLQASQSGRGGNPDRHQRQNGRNRLSMTGEHITGVDDALAQEIEFVIGRDDQVSIRARALESTLKRVDGAQDVDRGCDGVIDAEHVLRNSFWGFENLPFEELVVPSRA